MNNYSFRFKLEFITNLMTLIRLNFKTNTLLYCSYVSKVHIVDIKNYEQKLKYNKEHFKHEQTTIEIGIMH